MSAINTIGTGTASNVDSATTGNNAPTVANAIPDQSATAGTAFSYAFPANTFSDADSDTLTYTATKADATALPTWLSFTASTRAFSGTPQAADTGTVSVKVTASDGNGGSVSDEFDITVSRFRTPPRPPPAPPPSPLRRPQPAGAPRSNLSWTAPADNGGRVISGYKIEVSAPIAARPWSDLVANTNNTNTTYAAHRARTPAPPATTGSRPSTRSAPAPPPTSTTPPLAPNPATLNQTLNPSLSLNPSRNPNPILSRNVEPDPVPALPLLGQLHLALGLLRLGT